MSFVIGESYICYVHMPLIFNFSFNSGVKFLSQPGHHLLQYFSLFSSQSKINERMSFENKKRKKNLFVNTFINVTKQSRFSTTISTASPGQTL